MQKLSKRETYTPRNTSLVPCSVTLSLNKVERPSEQSFKTFDNNPEENLPQRKEDKKLSCMVYVLSYEGKSLMPTSPCKAKHLIKGGKAKVVKRFPFTIQLIHPLKIDRIQPIILGIDPGYKNVGISARTEKKELLSLNIKLRTDVSKKLTERRMYRRLKRNRLWYRKARFLNRVSTKKKGWLPPSIQHKLDSHIKLVKKIQSFLPISKIIVEVANFDIQKINNPDIKEIEYQKGNLFGYENVKSYLISREQNKCQLCQKESTKGNSFRIHHIILKESGGTDKPNNLALLHEKCHIKLHKKGLNHLLKKNKQFKAETFMSTIRWKLVEGLKKLCETNITFGHVTKIERNRLNLEKSHINDAFVISKGIAQERCKEVSWIQKCRNNRCLQLNRKGFKPSIRKKRYKIQSKDLVWVGRKMFISNGCNNFGKYVTYRCVDKKARYLKIEKVEKFYNYGGFYKGC